MNAEAEQINTATVGGFRYCPACGRPARVPRYGTNAEDWDTWGCSCCEREWTACPCTPVSEGPCRAQVESEADARAAEEYRDAGWAQAGMLMLFLKRRGLWAEAEAYLETLAREQRDEDARDALANTDETNQVG